MTFFFIIQMACNSCSNTKSFPVNIASEIQVSHLTKTINLSLLFWKSLPTYIHYIINPSECNMTATGMCSPGSEANLPSTSSCTVTTAGTGWGHRGAVACLQSGSWTNAFKFSLSDPQMGHAKKASNRGKRALLCIFKCCSTTFISQCVVMLIFPSSCRLNKACAPRQFLLRNSGTFVGGGGHSQGTWLGGQGTGAWPWYMKFCHLI